MVVELLFRKITPRLINGNNCEKAFNCYWKLIKLYNNKAKRKILLIISKLSSNFYDNQNYELWYKLFSRGYTPFEKDRKLWSTPKAVFSCVTISWNLSLRSWMSICTKNIFEVYKKYARYLFAKFTLSHFILLIFSSNLIATSREGKELSNRFWRHVVLLGNQVEKNANFV